MGGRGGRGGGGRGMSFTLEQMGMVRGEALPAPVLTPPPHYPLLEHYPAAMPADPRYHTMLSHRNGFLLHLTRRYGHALRLPAGSLAPSHRRTSPDTSDSSRPPHLRLTLDWTRFPSELRPTAASLSKRKSTSSIKSTKQKLPKVKNFEALLEELEKKEDVIVKKEVDEEEGGHNEEDEEMEDEEEEDEEMDEGTDYNQNYFDNGEGFLDEDDDADESPVY